MLNRASIVDHLRADIGLVPVRHLPSHARIRGWKPWKVAAIDIQGRP
jgi:hypothetical protein